MKTIKNTFVALIAAFILFEQTSVHAEDRSELLLKLLDEVQQMRQELQSLRNENEHLQYQFEQLLKKHDVAEDAPPALSSPSQTRNNTDAVPSLPITPVPETTSATPANTASETDDTMTTAVDTQDTKEQVPELLVKPSPPKLKKLSPAPKTTIVPKSMLTPKPATAEEEQDYAQVISYLNRGEFDRLQTALMNFLDRYENGTYAAEANYLLAEIHYEDNRYDKALQHFSRVAQQFPDSAKSDNARLKIAYIHYARENWPAARKLLETLISSEDSQIARLAQKRLDRMTQENR